MWAAHRKHFIIAVVVAVAATLAALTLIATLYHTPTCSDLKQNQGEMGIDCGGPCSRLCTIDQAPPSVRFTRQLVPVSGRTDVVAYVDNKNAAAAAKAAPYTITLYGPDNLVVAKKTGTVDLAPKSTTPIFVPGFYSGYQEVARAFLVFATSSIAWYRDTDVPPTLSVVNEVITADASPRLTATVQNPLATPFYQLTVVATVFDASNNAIAASQTVIPTLPALGSADVTFTWPAPFLAPPVREEILPLVPLP